MFIASYRTVTPYWVVRMLSAGDSVAHYRIVSRLGAGGMGVVYKAHDTRLERSVALKILPAEFAGDSDRTRRFLQEARAASALNHPNIATIYEIGEADGARFIAMEYVEGEPLSRRTGGGATDPDALLDLAIQTASALEEAHEKGVTHRDIKPANIMMTPKGQIKVLDFGLAKIARPKAGGDDSATMTEGLTHPGLVMGTVQYMSPEQALGRELDHRTDLFSFGVVLYELAAGRIPFAGATSTEILDRILHGQPDPLSRYHPSLPPELERIVRKCLEKDRERRYQSARELRVDLENLKRDSGSASADVPAPPARHRRRPWPALATLALAAAAFGVYWTLGRSGDAIGSLAVLPFVNAGGNPDAEYLSDGLTQSLINNLSRLPKLRVVPRTLVAGYKGPNVDPRKAGRDLKVRAVLTGRVTQRGDTLTLQAELTDLATESQLWGEQYTRKLADILAVQEDISKEISDKLRLRLSGEERKQLARHETANPEAYQLVLKGAYHMLKFTREGIDRSIEHFRKALDLDPSYALAYSNLSTAHLLEVVFLGRSPREKMPKAKDAARKALEIDDTLADAHYAMAGVQLHYDWDLPAAEKSIQRALELNPGLSDAHFIRGLWLAAQARLDESRKAFQRAAELAPLNLDAASIQGTEWFSGRRGEESIAINRKVLELDPNFYPARVRLGWALIFLGRPAEGIVEIEKARKLDDSPYTRASLAWAYAKAGRTADARRILGELKQMSSGDHVVHYDMAVVHLALGEKEAALDLLAKMYQDRAYSIVYLKADPAWDSVRSEPRFQEMLRRLKL